MNLHLFVNRKTFTPAFAMRTSRGSIAQKSSFFVFLQSGTSLGVGEGAPLPGLSRDGISDWLRLMQSLDQGPSLPELDNANAYSWASQVASLAGVGGASSIVFALEAAALSLLSGQPEVYFPSEFTQGSTGLEINGLVWMNDLGAMRKQAEEKVKSGFTTLKFKIGSFDWAQEKALLADFRRAHSAQEITVRVDANGAYSEEKAMRVLDDLQALDIHSIEQPIKAGQHNAMQRLITNGATPIALDEELNTDLPPNEIPDMLAYLSAAYWVLKPTLIGGLAKTEYYIKLAEELKANWWLTSSLETPIGLVPLAQLAANYANKLPHGLSTGKIFSQEIKSPIVLEKNRLFFNEATSFDLAQLQAPDPISSEA